MNKIAELKSKEITNIVSPIDSIIERAVTDPNFSVDKLEKMLEMKERHEANEARKEFTRAMSKFRSACPSITKNKKVKFQARSGNSTKYNYATLASAIDQIKDLMADCGLSHSWRTDQSDSIIKVTCYVTHELGHQESTSLSAPPHDDQRMNYIQRIASTVSYLERYTMFAILGLASAEMDNDGNNGDMPPADAPINSKESDNPTQKQIDSVVKLIEDGNELGFYMYLQKASNEMQIAILNSLPDKSKNKGRYREMEKRASDIVNRYANDIEGHAVSGDSISAGELLSEIKPHKPIYNEVWSLLSENCKSELKSTIQE